MSDSNTYGYGVYWGYNVDNPCSPLPYIYIPTHFTDTLKTKTYCIDGCDVFHQVSKSGQYTLVTF